ncbi:beta-glucosidase 12-like [Tripterygium wilfordii]|uniref:Beta-glucosidase 12-like n=1 Tax=Tripterygium wilfordii TaxID=458696 RepID=A0A7J7CP21_TRIWF|nr:beta-glucosidase 12-like [Tripterygium wilfordii]KAF5735748.1 beta-glucosidase 12-like [Tripterygium wilfordii]
MGVQNSLVLFLLLLGSLYSSFLFASGASSLDRTSFPPGFIFGTASASYQYEGAAREGGRGPSIWDYYTHKYPEKIADRSNGDVANDEYHRYKEDVGIMKEMGLDAYRFSISWSRILPNGKLSGGVNKEGINYYNNLINELLSHGIQPFVTLFHWDLPQTLEQEYGGFLSPRVVSHFRDYVETCFIHFGDRVKYWITLNEPWTYANGGYASASLAPYRCSAWQQLNCTGGDSATEPYLVAHNLLLSHATAINLYRQKYQATQKGKIGITLVSHWMVAYSSARHQQNAALRALDFMFGWFMDPISNGDYPHSMRSLVGNRLPKFTREESKMLKGSFDFLGLNYYTANYAAYVHTANNAVNVSYLTDARANLSTARNGMPIGPKAASDWLYVYPRGIRDILLYTKKKYSDPLIYITENGIDELNDATLSLEEALNDTMRIDYYSRHLSFLRRAVVEDGVKVKGYFAWSLLDNFEWSSGYTVRFGINYVDYKNGLKRYPKTSAHWFKNFLKK